METVTGMASPQSRKRSGWMSALHLYRLNYVSSMSRPYGTLTRRDAYSGEEEAAGISPLRSVTTINQSVG